MLNNVIDGHNKKKIFFLFHFIINLWHVIFFIFILLLINLILIIQSYCHLNLLDLTNIIYSLKSKQEVLFLLQNSHELRSTGGFIGALAYLKWNEFKIQEITFEDVYEVAGQVNNYLEPPHGVKEYLSGGKSWSLTDANWNPDFPQTAKQMAWFLEKGKNKKFDFIITINEQVLELLLSYIGNLNLVNSISLDQNNFMIEARKDRSTFFPGSLQKKHFLNSVKNSLFIKLKHLSILKKLHLFSLMKQLTIEKQIQFFSSNPQWELIFLKTKIAGIIYDPCNNNNCQSIFLVENNVGINKTNHQIERDYFLNQQNNLLTIKVNFKNNNKTDQYFRNQLKMNPLYKGAINLDYLNYYRIFIPKSLMLEKILLNGESIDYQKEEIETFIGQSYISYNFLMSVIEQNKTDIDFVFKTKKRLKKFFWQKQAGISSSNLFYNEKNLLINNDKIIKL